MSILPDILWALLILFVLGLCFLIVKLVQKKQRLHPELSRKLIHIFMGMTVLPFPLIFQYKLTVIVLGVLATGGLLGLRLFASRKDELGDVLYQVNRFDSIGELIYPAAVVCTYLIAPSLQYYVTPILVLAFSDSLAALVGTEYAKGSLSAHREAPKSFEGAVAFFFSAFMCVVSPLLLLSDLGGPEIWIVSLLTAALSTLLELVCPFGLDNFLIPVAIAIFLYHLASLTLGQLIFRLALFLVLICIAAFLNKRRNITTLGMVEALVAAFLTTLISSFFWVVPQLLLIGTYAFFPSLNQGERKKMLNYHNVECNVIPGLFIAAANALVFGSPAVFWTYTAYYSCMTAQNHFMRIKKYYPDRQKRLWLSAVLRGFLVQTIPASIICFTVYDTLPAWPWAVSSFLATATAITVLSTVTRRYSFPDMSIRLGWIAGSGALLYSCGFMTAAVFLL